MKYDFCGWATKNDLKCADGKIIRAGAFKVNDGKKVPLVWNHQHGSIGSVLGHAILENKDEGVYAYCSFNNTQAGQEAKEAVKHGDVDSLSIWANNLTQLGSEVLHGVIREVSLVLAGANPGAFIESVAHSMETIDDDDEEGIFYTGESLILEHAIEKDDDPAERKKVQMPTNNAQDGGKPTVGDVINTMSDDQKKAMAILVAEAVSQTKKESEEKEMKHNIFEDSSDRVVTTPHLSHDDMKEVFKTAKRLGSLKEAVKEELQEGGVLAHALDVSGMEVATGTQQYGINDIDMLFPDYKSLNTPPEFISRNMDWVKKLMGQVHHTPFSRIKSVYANITEDEARARGYIKGKIKKEEFFTTMKRHTDPQTIYKKQKLDRDDILDITSFDVIAWIRAEMRMMLEEEAARAILIGDGRPSDSDDKIQEIHIRPVVTDSPIFNTIVKVSVPADADEDVVAKETVKAIIKSRKKYKGSGNPTFWTTTDVVTDMLLLEDGIGHPLYKTMAELSTKLRVTECVEVEPMSGQEITIDSKKYPLIGTIVNFTDYNVGADKGGEVSMFDDFDIDYNQYKYLIESRFSGALVKPFSAVTFILDRAEGARSAQNYSSRSGSAE